MLQLKFTFSKVLLHSAAELAGQAKNENKSICGFAFQLRAEMVDLSKICEQIDKNILLF